MKTRLKLFVFVLMALLCFETMFAFPAQASENVDSKAGIIIDTGKEVKTACITFQGDSISGTQALELANAQPIFQTYSGTGKAVCSLCGVGCPAGNSCLTCMGSSFWNYFRAPKDKPSFQLSGIGAGSSQVRDGDVEGWKFGIGQQPPFKSFNTICGINVAVTQPGQSSTETVPNLKKSTSITRDSAEGNPPERGIVESPTKVLGKTQEKKLLVEKLSVAKDQNDGNSQNRYFLSAFAGLAALVFGFSLYKLIRANLGKQKNEL